MTSGATPTGQPIYFGKVPSRGDFVRSSAGSALIHSLDRWMSQTMEMISSDVRWKHVYDSAHPVSFAILGAHSPVGLMGHLLASQDASGRRFPFVLACAFDVQDPVAFLPCSPEALHPVWQLMASGAGAAHQAGDFSHGHDLMTALPLDVDTRADGLRQRHQAYAQRHSIASFEAAIGLAEQGFSFRQTALALGMLLQPVLSQGHGELRKALVLPLARDPSHRAHSLTVWFDLVARFFKRTAAEVAVMATVHEQQPVLVLGFRGASAATLCTVLDPQRSQQENVAIAEAQWVEDWIGGDYGLRKLSNYLRDPSLSLAAASQVFRETFLGE